MNPFELFVNMEEAWKLIDHRVDGWPFMSSIWPVCVLIILAFAVVLYGPIHMRTREPLNIGLIMAFFNIFIVVFNVYIACQLWIGGSRKQYSWICQPNDSNATDIEEMRIVEAMHLVLICKLMEMFDSFFLIARKKSMGKNGLLVFHHAYAACITWMVVRWIPGGPVFALATINCVVHAIIYTYFCIAIFLPKAVKSSFIKKAFSCVLVLQWLGFVVYFLMIVWVQCPSTLLLIYSLLILFLIMMMFHSTTFFFDYHRNGYKGEGLIRFAIRMAMHSGDRDVKCD